MSNARNLADLLGTNTTIQTAKLADDAVTGAKLPTGSVLQVVQGELGTTTSKSPAQGTDAASGLTATITPSSSSSKILVQYTIYLGHQSGYNMTSQLYRGSTAIGKGTPASNRRGVSTMVTSYNPGDTGDEYALLHASHIFLDSPATTSATAYAVHVSAYNGGTIYVNRNKQFQDIGDYDSIPLSTITLMEIKG